MTRERPATLQEVADLSGVSRGTASRALSGSGRVSPQTRQRVREAAAQLEYSTNSGARNLRRARAGSLGLWLPPGLRFMDYYMNFTFGVVEATNNRELTVSLIPNEFPPGRARSLHVDGFVMSDVVADDALAEAILGLGRPVVTSELVPAGLPRPAASVIADHDAATRDLLDRLRASGATSILVLIPEVDQTWVQGVRTAVLEWSTTRRVPLVLAVLNGIPGEGELHETIARELATRPDVDAIVCVPDGLGVGVLSALQKLGRAVPADVQLVSYVDGATLPIVQPPVTALDLRPREAGLRAGQLLIDLLDSDDAAGEPAPLVEMFDLRYRQRGSTK